MSIKDRLVVQREFVECSYWNSIRESLLESLYLRLKTNKLEETYEFGAAELCHKN